jgi:hypothetical protein
MAEYDLHTGVKHVAAVAPAVITATTTTSATIDTKGFESVEVLSYSGSAAMDGSFSVAVHESDASASGFAAAADADVIGGTSTTPPVLNTPIGEESLNLRMGYIGKKRYIRIVVTELTANTTGVIGASVLLGNPSTGPVINQNITPV